MDTLYERIEFFCKTNDINITLMCKEAGISRGSITDLKVGRNKTLKPETLDKIANYFSTTVDYLLGRTDDIAQKEKTPTPTEKSEREISDDDIKFALFGDKTIDDETFESVKNFAKFAAEQKRKRKEGDQ